jgi:hypothetical protein
MVTVIQFLGPSIKARSKERERYLAEGSTWSVQVSTWSNWIYCDLENPSRTTQGQRFDSPRAVDDLARRRLPDPPPPFKVVRAFPNLKFMHPLLLARPRGSDRLFVGEQDGVLYSFLDRPDARAELHGPDRIGKKAAPQRN